MSAGTAAITECEACGRGKAHTEDGLCGACRDLGSRWREASIVGALQVVANAVAAARELGVDDDRLRRLVTAQVPA